MQTLIYGAIVALAIGVLLLPVLGAQFGSAVLVIASLCFLPLTVYAVSDVYHVGIAAPALEVRTFTIALVFAWIVSVGGKLKQERLTMATLATLAALLLLVWPTSDETTSGAIHLGLAAIAFSVGRAWNRALTAEFAMKLLGLIAAVIVVQGLVTGLQFAGLPINAVSGMDAEYVGNRVNGTSNHPNNLGKMIFLLTWMTLWATKSPNILLARRAWFIAIVGLFPLALAAGRANLIATLTLILIWVLIQPRKDPLAGGRNVVVGGVLASIAALFLVISRFQSDTTGGVRSELISLALANLPSEQIFGVGPNRYVTEMSPRTDSYIPVHNSFLLIFVEMGFAGLILATGILMIALFRSLPLILQSGVQGDQGRLMVSGLPGLLFISLTGWGILGTGMLPILMLVLGFVFPTRNQPRDNGARRLIVESRAPCTETPGLSPKSNSRQPTLHPLNLNAPARVMSEEGRK